MGIRISHLILRAGDHGLVLYLSSWDVLHIGCLPVFERCIGRLGWKAGWACLHFVCVYGVRTLSSWMWIHGIPIHLSTCGINTGALFILATLLLLPPSAFCCFSPRRPRRLMRNFNKKVRGEPSNKPSASSFQKLECWRDSRNPIVAGAIVSTSLAKRDLTEDHHHKRKENEQEEPDIHGQRIIF